MEPIIELHNIFHDLFFKKQSWRWQHWEKWTSWYIFIITQFESELPFNPRKTSLVEIYRHFLLTLKSNFHNF